VSCPIGLVPATTEVERIKLNQLNSKTGNRISLKPVDSETGEPLERSEIVKGYKLEGDQYVIWPAPGSADTELGVLMEREVGHGETDVYAGVQA
jgi:non-homologous end joining protein Ku